MYVAKEPCPSPHGRCSPSASYLRPQRLAVISPVSAAALRSHAYIHSYARTGVQTRPLHQSHLCAQSVIPPAGYLCCRDHSPVFRHRRSSCLRHKPHASHPCSPLRPLIGSCACKRLNHLPSPLLRLLHTRPLWQDPPEEKKTSHIPGSHSLRLTSAFNDRFLSSRCRARPPATRPPEEPCSAHHPLALSIFFYHHRQTHAKMEASWELPTLRGTIRLGVTHPT